MAIPPVRLRALRVEIPRLEVPRTARRKRRCLGWGGAQAAAMPSKYSVVRAVEFAETDMAGIAHFSNFFRWMESCETAFYASLKLPLVSFLPGQVVGWPRVRAACEYRAPLRLGDRVQVTLFVKEVRTRAVVYVFQFRRIVRGRPERKVSAQGEITAVCVAHGADGGMVSSPIPAKVRAKLKVAPASAWAE